MKYFTVAASFAMSTLLFTPAQADDMVSLALEEAAYRV